MGVSCRIHIKKTEEGIHRAGQPLCGILSYAIDEPTEYQTAVLSFVGSAHCKWREYDLKHEHPVIHVGHDEFLSLHVNIFNKRPEQTITLDVGTYEYHFQFVLPPEIPCSFRDGYSNVTYQLKAKFVKPSFFSFNSKFEREVTVYGNVNPVTAVESRTYDLQKKLFKWFSTAEHIVQLKARIAKSFLTPGENATVDLLVNNDTDTEVSYITTELCCKTTYTAKTLLSHHTKEVTETLRGCTGITPSVPPYKTAHFACIVPTLPHLYSIQHCKIINKEYYIKVAVNLPFPHMKATCDVPIVIGEGRQGDGFGIVELGDDFHTDLAPNGSDSPPSYWEVMNIDNTAEASGSK